MTLAELLVAMIVTVVFFSVALAVGSRVFFAADNQQARAADLSANRRVVQLLDRQVRYANAVMTPVASGGSVYATWQSGSVNVAGVPHGAADLLPVEADGRRRAAVPLLEAAVRRDGAGLVERRGRHPPGRDDPGVLDRRGAR